MRIVEELGRLGLLTGIDRAALGAYCSAFARWHDAQKRLDKQGLTIESPNGMMMPWPFISIMNQAAAWDLTPIIDDALGRIHKSCCPPKIDRSRRRSAQPSSQVARVMPRTVAGSR